MAGAAALRGRPFRALAGLLLLLGLWLAWRVPRMDAQLARIAAQLAPAPPAPRRPVGHAAPLPAPPPVPSPAAPSPAAPSPAAPSPPALPPAIAPVPPTTQLLPPVVPVARLPLAPGDPAPVVAGERPPPPQPPPQPAPLAAGAAQPTLPTAFALAQLAYDRLRSGQRRQAAALFDAALNLQPGNRQWQADRAALGRRWHGEGFALLRDGGRSGPAASPVLGGGQLGGSIAFLPDPYARRPLALVARGFVAADPAGLRRETAQATIGLRQPLLPGVSISAERLIAIGRATRGDWTLRLAAGASRGRWTAYGEAGVLGSGDAYAGAQASARLLRIGPIALAAGSWASVQTGSPDVWRIDVGPSLAAEMRGLRLSADWRQRVAGNAAPGSGPALTLSTAF